MAKRTKRKKKERLPVAKSFYEGQDRKLIQHAFNCLSREFYDKMSIIAFGVKAGDNVTEALNNFHATENHIKRIRDNVTRSYPIEEDVVRFYSGLAVIDFNVNNTSEYLQFLEKLLEIKKNKDDSWTIKYEDIIYKVLPTGRIEGFCLKWEKKQNKILKQLLGF